MTFDEWFNEREGFGFRCERALEDFNNSITLEEFGHEIDPAILEFWLRAAYEVGYQAGYEQAESEFPTWDLRE